MKITIHRGINQIGGCITEIATHSTRIFIDLGQNLPDNEGQVSDYLADEKEIQQLTNGVNAIFYTHYHGDHFGHFVFVPVATDQYIGAVARKIAFCKANQLKKIKGREDISEKEISQINRMKSLTQGKAVVVGDIRITPFMVSHSAYESYMFLIEAEGKRVLHTGDFRNHGYLGKKLFDIIEKYIIGKGKIDFLITEGTMLSRLNEKVRHEAELQKEIATIMTNYKNLFVMCSSTDLERLATIYNANKRTKNRPFVCDDYQKEVLSIFSETAGRFSAGFNFEKVYAFRQNNQKLIGWMQDKGFCMLVRATDKFVKYVDSLSTLLNPSEMVLIYSMWKEYANAASKHAKKEYISFIEKFPNVKFIHTSGHASSQCLEEVCNKVNPYMGIIPIHSECAEEYKKLNIADELKNKIITSSTTIEDIEIKIVV